MSALVVVVLVLLAVVLAGIAALAVVVLRHRSAPDPAQPRTVAELVRMRAERAPAPPLADVPAPAAETPAEVPAPAEEVAEPDRAAAAEPDGAVGTVGTDGVAAAEPDRRAAEPPAAGTTHAGTAERGTEEPVGPPADRAARVLPFPGARQDAAAPVTDPDTPWARAARTGEDPLAPATWTVPPAPPALLGETAARAAARSAGAARGEGPAGGGDDPRGPAAPAPEGASTGVPAAAGPHDQGPAGGSTATAGSTAPNGSPASHRSTSPHAPSAASGSTGAAGSLAPVTAAGPATAPRPTGADGEPDTPGPIAANGSTAGRGPVAADEPAGVDDRTPATGGAPPGPPPVAADPARGATTTCTCRSPAADPVPAARPSPAVERVTAGRAPTDEQAAAGRALQRTFGVEDDRAPVVALRPSDTGALPVVAAPSGPPQPVRLRAVDRDGVPVAGARAALLDDRGRESATVTAGADGTGELVAPHPGGYVVVFTAPAHQAGAVAVTVADAPLEVELPLARSASLSGSVRTEDGPLAGARVALLQDDETVAALASGPDGAFRFDDLAGGEYDLRVTSGHRAATVPVDLPDGADVHHDVDVRPAGLATGERR